MVHGIRTRDPSRFNAMGSLSSHSISRPSERRLVILCLTYSASALLYAPKHYFDFLWIYVASGVLTVVPAVGLVVVGLAFVKGRPAPLAYLKQAFGGQFLYMTWAIAVFIVSITAFTTWKYNIPALMPFYADPYLAELERRLHGADAWMLLHQVLPTWCIYLIQPIYSTVWFTLWFGVVGYVAVWLEGPARQRYFWSLALTMISIGTVLATLLASVGPIFYDHFLGGTRFHDLRTALDSTRAGRQTLHYAVYLIESYRSGESVFGSGISAMPSVHVAIAFLNALLFASHSRSIAAAGWAFAFIILLGSVYTGWHYAVDGYVSVVVVLVIWCLVSRALGLPVTGSPRRNDRFATDPGAE